MVRNILYYVKNAIYYFNINSKKKCLLVHQSINFFKKIQLKNVCLDLINSLSINSRNNKKILNNINDIKNKENNNLIKSINFLIYNIINQRIIENQILNNKNNCNSNIYNIYNTLSFNSNNMDLNSIYK